MNMPTKAQWRAGVILAAVMVACMVTTGCYNAREDALAVQEHCNQHGWESGQCAYAQSLAQQRAAAAQAQRQMLFNAGQNQLDRSAYGYPQ